MPIAGLTRLKASRPARTGRGGAPNVLRGGSWNNNNDNNFRGANRNNNGPGNCNNNNGFRLASTLPMTGVFFPRGRGARPTEGVQAHVPRRPPDPEGSRRLGRTSPLTGPRLRLREGRR
ncbi:MAG: hypothetical protein FJX76_02370 [Armatimonadetes bacterium]|nr:hypothetical protein [Armatimonadota bacterium]